MRHYQKGAVSKQGARGQTVYVGRWRGAAKPDGTRTRHKMVLGYCSEMSQTDARDKLEGHLRTLGNLPTESAHITFGNYWTNRYVPKRRAAWSKPTEHGYNNYYHLFFAGKFGDVRITDMSPDVLASFFITLRDEKYSRSVIRKVWTLLKAVLDHATDNDVLLKNPMRKVEYPKTDKPKKPVLSSEQVTAVINRAGTIGPMVNAIMHTAIFCAMRPSEVFALKWSSLAADQFNISDSAWHGEIFADTTKTDAPRIVSIPPGTLAAIQAWRKVTKFAAPGDLIFCNKKGKPLSAHNFRNRVLAPLQRELGITVPLSFQVMRRSHATRNQARAKDLQSHLGHSSIVTTLGTYAQEIPASVREMVTADEALITGKVGPKVGPKKLHGPKLAPSSKLQRRVSL